MSVPPLVVALELLFFSLALVGLALIVAAAILNALARRTRDFVQFEARSILAQRLLFASAAPLVLDVLVESPLVGAALAALVIGWIVWWLPPSRRRMHASAQAVFVSPPQAVASVMFDVSEQARWMESVHAATLETPGLLRVGSVIRQTVMFGTRELVAISRVTELEPYRKLVLLRDARYAAPTEVMDVAPRGSGSLVTYGGGNELRLVTAVVGGWRLGGLRATFIRRRTTSLERLRRLVDPTGPSSAAPAASSYTPPR